MKKFLKISILMVIIIACGLVYFNIQTGPYDESSNEKVLVNIPSGSSLNKISDILFEKKLIKNKLFFVSVAKINNMDKDIKAGIYNIPKSLSNKEILFLLNSGKVYKDIIKVTIPEGFEANQIADRLSTLGIVDREKFLELVNNPSIFKEKYPFLNSENIISLEGFLFPDTYFIDKNYSEKVIIDIMLKRFNEIYNAEYKKRQKELGLNLNEIITIASIIEREAKLDKERPLVSAVFYNRININMPLQSCATVQYVLGERKSVLSYDDIKIDSPYNTYKNNGLPPSPIASPGEKSIKAALYPEDVDYLYFVAKKDGSHSFSKTYNEHLKRKAENK
ncbi:endolytic transglycosylase MltG [Tepidibacter formicigenes]|jgi:UPF0755 protein|uniref:Endolytic murein transglycosylase n=1 Tax=Tepidibacter formicigenes DSM 15518 TaxID=1123349 RepID=A0A1M6L088_9FIRM|nr:endolytic transglycosylase MltG [Tepidibacter formicigenes]SHJ64603.1 UPF0755 protein [Tepidibacter formicigenes DSM 15518]